MTYFRTFCYLNSSCIRRSITLMFMSFSKNKFKLLKQNSVTDVSVGFRPPCWSCEHQHGVSYKSLWVWVKHFFGYLVYEIFLWPESWPGSLNMCLLSVPRFWTLSIEWFWFLFWSILNGVTLKTSICLKSVCNFKVTRFYLILLCKQYTWTSYIQALIQLR